jgi:flagellar basal-body rod protein FlgF
MYRQDVLSNNLANLNTAGFKPDVAVAMPREVVRIEDGVMDSPSNELLERLGGGVLLQSNRVNFAQGTLNPSGNALDVALDGPGMFRVSPAGSPEGKAMLTRDGRMTLNSSGTLVTASGGAPVLDSAGNEITLRRGGSIQIDGRGVIRQNGAPVATLGVFQVQDPTQIEKAGDGIMRINDSLVSELPSEQRRVRHFAYEDSGVNEIRTLMDLTSASRSIDSNVSLMEQHDKMMEQAINSLGKVT